jgi:DNA polymerase-3 subunit epsilon
MILVLDTETSGLDPKNDDLIEVGWAKFDDESGSLIRCGSDLIHPKMPLGVDFTNMAVHVNGIKDVAIAKGERRSIITDPIAGIACATRCIVAHNAAFDRQWFPEWPAIPWVCSMRDIEWPRETGRRVSLEKLALAHGIGVLPGHRAIHDVLTIVRVLEVVAAMGTSVQSLIDRALRPRKTYQSMQPFAQNKLASEAGFAFDGGSKRWLRDIADEDFESLSRTFKFQVRLAS